ncbi:MAG: type II toxin-antitoxin system HicB family antitoxin [Oscillospiraceae bacterium]|jgi:predicted RNase H-like HicB family nuclease|nr:type II toxin-antitoxin system HicB family antitoxin [Oscillospiraceae bacterium]
MVLLYPARFIPFEDSEDGYTVEIPDLPGCVTQGNNLANAVKMAVDAASGWVLDELEDGRPAPAATSLSLIPSEIPGEIISLIYLDMDAYAEKYGEKAVRKNLTIPAWLAAMADKANLNYSATLQKALMSELGVRS